MICSGSTAFLVILFSILFGCSVHKINEGTVGIYFRSGALVDKVTYPGIHFALPFITDIERIKIRPRTDTLPGIKTITKDGIENEFHCLATDILVDHVESNSGSIALQLGDPARDLLDAVHLLVQEVGLEEIAEMGVTVSCLVHVEKTLIDRLLQLKGSLHGLQRSAPLHSGRLG